MCKLLGDRRPLLIGLFLIALTVVAFWQTLGHDFVNYDDDEYITENGRLTAGLTTENIAWAFTSTSVSNWHPLTWISHMLDVQLYGLNPKGHHLTNLLFHMANVLLLFLLLSWMTGSLWRSAFVAALFGIHPLHVESVAWVAERKDVLSTFFWLLTMLAYVWYVQRPQHGRYLLVVLLFALGLMSKPMLVTLPFMLLLMDYWPLKRLTATQSLRSTLNTQHSTLSRLILEKAPLFALSAASSVVTYIVQQRTGAVGSLEKLPFGERVANALVAYVGYIVKMIWPQNLAVFYPHPKGHLPAWEVLGAAVLLASVSLLVMRAGRARLYLPVGWLWYLVTLVPVIGLVQVGEQAMADRYTYVPLIGLFVMVAWGVPDLLNKRSYATEAGQDKPPRVSRPPSQIPLTVPLAIVVIAALRICTWIQIGYWRDSISLFEHALACTKDNYVAHSNLAIALAAEGNTDRAISHCEDALRIRPQDAHTHNNFGVLLLNQRRFDEAMAQFVEALRLEPGDVSATNNLGLAFFWQGRIDQAISYFRNALRTDPDYVNARLNLGLALARKRKPEQAIAELWKAFRANPRNLESLNSIGAVLIKQRRLGEAMNVLAKALAINPNDGHAHFNMAIVLFYKGNYAAAWKEVGLARNNGWSVNPRFLRALSQKMPEPRY